MLIRPSFATRQCTLELSTDGILQSRLFYDSSFFDMCDNEMELIGPSIMMPERATFISARRSSEWKNIIAWICLVDRGPKKNKLSAAIESLTLQLRLLRKIALNSLLTITIVGKTYPTFFFLFLFYYYLINNLLLFVRFFLSYF